MCSIIHHRCNSRMPFLWDWSHFEMLAPPRYDQISSLLEKFIRDFARNPTKSHWITCFLFTAKNLHLQNLLWENRVCAHLHIYTHIQIVTQKLRKIVLWKVVATLYDRSIARKIINPRIYLTRVVWIFQSFEVVFKLVQV